MCPGNSHIEFREGDKISSISSLKMGWVLVAHIFIKFLYSTENQPLFAFHATKFSSLCTRPTNYFFRSNIFYLRFHILLEQTCVIVANATVARTSLTLWDRRLGCRCTRCWRRCLRSNSNNLRTASSRSGCCGSGCCCCRGYCGCCGCRASRCGIITLNIMYMSFMASLAENLLIEQSIDRTIYW